MGIYQFDINGNQTGDIILTPSAGTCINCSQNASASATNSGNGAGSTNDATATTNNNSTTNINNNADVTNNIDLTADTGNNKASFNTGGDSSIKTGDANVVANVVNAVNTVVSGVINTVNIFGNLVGNIILPSDSQSQASACSTCCGQNVSATNSGNGANSTNNANATSSSTSTTNQTNTANINNNLNLNANTGGNSADFNTGGNSVIDTGQVKVDSNTVNVANVNVASGDCSPLTMVFVNDPNHNWQGSIVGAAPGTYFYTSDGLLFVVDKNGQLQAVNSGNGAGSTNNANATSSTNTTVNQTNNAALTNNININANTGNNKTNFNTNGDSSISTGNVNVIANVFNFINSNFSGRQLVLTVVNVFGSWLGSFVPPGFSAPPPPSSAQAQGSGQNQGSQTNSQGNSGGGSSSSGVSSQVVSISQSNNSNNTGSVAKVFGLVSGFRTQNTSGQNGGNSSSVSQGSNGPANVGGFSIDPKLFFLLIPLVIFLSSIRRKFTFAHSRVKTETGYSHRITIRKK